MQIKSTCHCPLGYQASVCARKPPSSWNPVSRLASDKKQNFGSHLGCPKWTLSCLGDQLTLNFSRFAAGVCRGGKVTLLPQAPGETLPLEDPRRPHDQSLPKTGMTGHRGPQRPMRPSWDPNFFSLGPNHLAFGESRKWVHALLTKSPAAW